MRENGVSWKKGDTQGQLHRELGKEVECNMKSQRYEKKIRPRGLLRHRNLDKLKETETENKGNRNREKEKKRKKLGYKETEKQ